MDRTVRKEIIINWLHDAGENAVARLSVVSQVSTRIISAARAGHAPKKAITRQLICQAIGVSEETLFPSLPEKRADRKRIS